jgi:lipopolysaccharide assembly outer membrane protein LptD (OstA)
VRSARTCALLLAALALPGVALAQGPSTCQPQLDSARMGRHIEIAPGQFHQFGAGGVFARCIDQPTTMQADSVAWFSERDLMEFVGSVRFQDSTVSLDADRARYYPSVERLEAFGNVRLENQSTGAVLAGPNLVYLRAVAGLRDTSELNAVDRPLVEYRPTRDPSAVPYIIRGDHVLLRGEVDAWAGGAVTIDREDIAARGDSAVLKMDVGEGVLIGHAQAAGTDSVGYTIEGDRVAFRLTDDELTWVQAQRDASARSAEWRAAGDTIEFNVERDMVQGGSVWGDSVRSRAMSSQYQIEADSLAIDSPDQLLTEVRSFGFAKATSLLDTLTAEPDWMAGDTLVARFGDAPSGRRILVLLEARGNAQAFYNIYESPLRIGPPSLNYSRGARIAAHFSEDMLDRVDVLEGADGVYLEPAERRRP